MSALDELVEPAARPSAFFAALTAADDHLAAVEQLRAENHAARNDGKHLVDYHNRNAQLLRENAALTAERDRLASTASFAPPITSGASCCCGARLEIRSDQIELTADEKTAAMSAVADMFGRGPLDDLDAAIVARVVDVINHERACGDYDMMRDFNDAHAYCRDTGSDSGYGDDL